MHRTEGATWPAVSDALRVVTPMLFPWRCPHVFLAFCQQLEATARERGGALVFAPANRPLSPHRGRLAGRIGRTPVLLLTTVGRKSGQPHTVPLGYFDQGDTRFVVASNGGAVRDPAWYLNLTSHPEVRVEVGSDEYQAIARAATGEERARLWDHLMAVAPAYRRYAHSQREMPVVMLRRVPAGETRR